jgi:alkylated DNA repair dioxygenase AlkB
MKFILLRSRPRHRAHWPAAARWRRPFARPALPEQGTAMSVAMLLAWGWDARADPTRRSKLRSPRRPDPRPREKKAPAGGGDRQALPARTLVRP